MNDGSWHHVVFTVGASGSKLYLDGSMVYHLAGPTTHVDLLFRWVIGAGMMENPLTGSLAEVAVYSTELSAARVLTHYQAAGV